MKEMLTRNIGLKILSIILAAILWLVITNLDDPVTTKTFNNVPVETLNVDEITDLGQVYNILEGKTINFTVAARRKIADTLTVSDFSVTSDFSKLSDVNAVTIKINCPRYAGGVTVTDGLYQVMKINREELTKKNFNVNVVQKGEPAEGYYVAEKTTTKIIVVSGPKTKIESIDQIVVNVDVSEEAGSFRTTEEPKALDKEGNEIDASNLTFSDSTVAVNIGMYRTKTIDLLITPTGKTADGFVMTTVDFEPKTIEVAGTDEALLNIKTLTVMEDIDGASVDFAKEINLQEQLSDGLVLVGDNQTAVINIGIKKAETKELFIWPKDIEVRNKPADLQLEFINSIALSVQTIGPVDEMADLTAKNIKPYIDLTGYTGGTYNLEIGIETTGYVTITNNPKISFTLKQQ